MSWLPSNKCRVILTSREHLANFPTPQQQHFNEKYSWFPTHFKCPEPWERNICPE